MLPDSGSCGTDANPPAPNPDMNACLAELNDLDISPEAKEEFVRTLHNLLLAFVELGFGLHPVHHTRQKSSEKAVKPADNTTLSLADMLYLASSNRTQSNHTSGHSEEQGES